jgi:hypothetical protein
VAVEEPGTQIQLEAAVLVAARLARRERAALAIRQAHLHHKETMVEVLFLALLVAVEGHPRLAVQEAPIKAEMAEQEPHQPLAVRQLLMPAAAADQLHFLLAEPEQAALAVVAQVA